MKIRLVDNTIYPATRAEVINGRLEIDFTDRTAEEVQDVFSIPANLQDIELLTDSEEKYGELSGWTAYGGLTMLGDTKTAILTKPVDATEERLTTAESNALAAKTATESQEEVIEQIRKEIEGGSAGGESYSAVLAMSRISALSITDDTQALQVQSLYGEWDGNGKAYKAGTYFNYLDVLYKVLKDHTSQAGWTPDTAASLYAKVLTDPSGKVLPWVQPDSTNPYNLGDRVTHAGETWESLVDGNVWEPGAVGTEGQWKKVAE